MRLQLSYGCVSHVGRRRRTNQDNFACDGAFMGPRQDKARVWRRGVIPLERPVLFGVFDGMGGGEQGEQASFLAARRAAGTSLDQPPRQALEEICTEANRDICAFAAGRRLEGCGTTAAMLVFGPGQVTLCSLGDSRVFQIAGGRVRQISQDHVTPAPFGRKPPLLQYLGIPPEEMHLRPACGAWPCRAGDRYLICSDGLTDLVPPGELAAAAAQGPLDRALEDLLGRALERGGTDNITIILVQLGRREPGWLQSAKGFLRRMGNVTGN